MFKILVFTLRAFDFELSPDGFEELLWSLGQIVSPKMIFYLSCITMFFAYPVSHCLSCSQRNIWLQKLSQLWCPEEPFLLQESLMCWFQYLNFLLVVQSSLDLFLNSGPCTTAGLELFLFTFILLITLHCPSSNANPSLLCQSKSYLFFILQLRSHLLWESFSDYSCLINPIILSFPKAFCFSPPPSFPSNYLPL